MVRETFPETNMYNEMQRREQAAITGTETRCERNITSKPAIEVYSIANQCTAQTHPLLDRTLADDDSISTNSEGQRRASGDGEDIDLLSTLAIV